MRENADQNNSEYGHFHAVHDDCVATEQEITNFFFPSLFDSPGAIFSQVLYKIPPILKDKGNGV